MTTDNIMVIDDDRDPRESMDEILEDQGYAVIACETAGAALQKITEAIPRVVLVDNMMPGMGEAFACRLANPIRRQILAALAGMSRCVSWTSPAPSLSATTPRSFST